MYFMSRIDLKIGRDMPHIILIMEKIKLKVHSLKIEHKRQSKSSKILGEGQKRKLFILNAIIFQSIQSNFTNF